jgi:hypothetical protein
MFSRRIDPTLPFVLAMAVAVVCGCDNSPVKTRTCPTGLRAVVTTTDYETGSLSTVTGGADYGVAVGVAEIHSDAVVRVFSRRVYVVNRYGADNIQVLDPDHCFSLARQFSVGNGSDPHDILVVDDQKAYVTRYNETELWIVDPITGRHKGSIDLGFLADADGIPEMDQLALAGRWLFVTLQRLDRNTPFLDPTDESYVAVIDVGTNTIVDTDPQTPGTQPIVLGATNPFSTLQLDPSSGRLYVACVGDWGANDAGVVTVDPNTLSAGAVWLTGAAAGGDVTDVEVVSADRGYAIVTDAAYHTTLIAFDPGSGAVVDTVYAPGDFTLQDAEVSPAGDLFVADRSVTEPGIRVYDAATGAAKTAAPIDVGLPPFSIAFTD